MSMSLCGGQRRSGFARIACALGLLLLLLLAINLAAGAYVYPMRPHSIDPLLFGGGAGNGVGNAGGGGGGGAGGYGDGGGAMLPKKRPFCNAFTGCGRKRSDPEMSVGSVQRPMALPLPLSQRQFAADAIQQLQQQQQPPNPADVMQSDDPTTMEAQPTNGGGGGGGLGAGFDDTLVDLLDLNSEPAIEDLMRQIMSQAKMWEAIQEANREMNMQKNDRNQALVAEGGGGGGDGQQRARISFPTMAFNSQ